MKFISLTIPKLEKYAKFELKEDYNIDSKISDTLIEFETASFKTIAEYCYNVRASNKVILLIEENKIKNFNDVKINFKKIPLKGNFNSFMVRCKRIGDHNFKSIDVEKQLGDYISENFKLKVDLENPDIIFYSYINNDKLYFGIDLIGFDLSKRDYKIFNNPHSIKGNLAYILLMVSEYQTNMSLLDPITNSGEIVIEAASLINNKSIHHFQKDKFFLKNFEEFSEYKISNKTNKEKGKIYAYSDSQKCIATSKKNAKIAELAKEITFSRTEIEWLDTKFEKNSIDRIVTILSKSSLCKDDVFKKSVKDFFHQAKFILKKEGILVILTRNPKFFNGYQERIDLKNNSILKFTKII